MVCSLKGFALVTLGDLVCASFSPCSSRLEINENLFPLASDMYAARLYRAIFLRLVAWQPSKAVMLTQHWICSPTIF